jgi:hypothetical protein
MLVCLPILDAPWPVGFLLLMPFWIAAWVGTIRLIRDYRNGR